MTKLELAKEVWSHLGQRLEGLDEGSVEAKTFNDLFESSRRKIIYKTASVAFLFPFRPDLLYPIDYESTDPDDQNPYKDIYHVYSYPDFLIQLTSRKSAMESGVFSQGDLSSIVPRFTTGYEQGKKRRVILLKEALGEDQVLTGLLDVEDLRGWPAQMIECLSLYMAWLMSPKTSDGKDRSRLAREFEMSLSQAKIYDYSEAERNEVRQGSDFTDIIDSNRFRSTDFTRNY